MIRDKFREYRDLVFGYSSFLGLLISLAYLSYNLFASSPLGGINLAIITLSFVILCLSMGSIYITRRYDNLRQIHENSATEIERLKTEKEREINTKTLMAQIFHNFSHEYRKVINELHSDLRAADYGKFDDRKRTFKMFLIFMLANIKEIFDVLTGGSNSVCIKILDKRNDEYIVRTYMRDSVSYRKRSEIDRALFEYSYHTNTAFKNILDVHCPDSYFLCNDLLSEYQKGHYVNENKNWQKLYNACLVTPIRYIIKKSVSEGKTEIDSNVLGFICVDNVNGCFDETGKDVLASFADGCFHLFSVYFEFENQARI